MLDEHLASDSDSHNSLVLFPDKNSPWPPPPQTRLLFSSSSPTRTYEKPPDSARFRLGSTRPARLGSPRGVTRRLNSQAMAAAETAATTSTCTHCQREIPSSNIALHSAHCARNLQKCEHCGDMVPRKHMDEHYDENHAQVNCSLCKGTVERELWELHKGIQCPQRMLACQYCEFELPAVDLFEHQDVCGNRTEYCQPCRKYIRLREWIGHEIQFHANSNAAAESSSDGTMVEKEERAPAAEQPVRPAHGSQRKQLLFAIAITGIAILIGSILFQKKG